MCQVLLHFLAQPRASPAPCPIIFTDVSFIKSEDSCVTLFKAVRYSVSWVRKRGLCKPLVMLALPAFPLSHFHKYVTVDAHEPIYTHTHTHARTEPPRRAVCSVCLSVSLCECVPLYVCVCVYVCTHGIEQQQQKNQYEPEAKRGRGKKVG